MSDDKNTENTDSQFPGNPAWEHVLLEKAVLASVNEQRASRRWKITLRAIYLLFLALIVGRLVIFSGDRPAAGTRHTALVSLEGEIAANSQASAEKIIDALNLAFSSQNAAGVILRINSPGGSPVQSDMIYREIRRLRALHPDKLLYAVAEDLCASGGYYIASAADKIFVNRASIVGSIGVRMDNFGLTRLMDKLGVERRLITAGENKGFYDPFSPEAPRQKEHAKKMLAQIHRQFINAVRQGRGKRLKETPDIFSGLFWTGEYSVVLGLADGFGDVNYVARELFKAKDIIDYTTKESIADRLARKLGLAASVAAVHILGLSVFPAIKN